MDSAVAGIAESAPELNFTDTRLTSVVLTNCMCVAKVERDWKYVAKSFKALTTKGIAGALKFLMVLPRGRASQLGSGLPSARQTETAVFFGENATWTTRCEPFG